MNRQKKEIVCPNCHTTFQVDDSTYESIVAQVKTQVFNEELATRLEETEKQNKIRQENIRLETEKAYEERQRKEREEISSLRNEVTRLSEVVAAYDARM